MGLGGFGGKAKKGAEPPPSGETPRPQLLNADANPTLRYPVCVWALSSKAVVVHQKFLSGGAARASQGVSCGWLDLTRSGALYSPVVGRAGGGGWGGPRFVAPSAGDDSDMQVSESGGEGFEANSSETASAQFVKGLLYINASERKFYLTYSPESEWEKVANPDQFFRAAKLNMDGTVAVQRAMQNFEGVLAEVKPPASAPEVTLHAEPGSVEKGHSVALVWTSSNATSLDLEPGVGKVAAAGGMSLTPSDSTSYTLTAAGPGGTKTATAFVTVTQPAAAVLPTIVLTEPSSAGDGQTVDVPASPLTIRGVVMDASGIPVVTVNGRSVTMRPTSAQAAQFSSDPMVLQPGDNRFQVVATNSSQGKAQVAFIARLNAAPPKPPPAPPANSKGLGKAEILSLLQGDVPSARVAELVKERGIKFTPSPDDLKDIRAAGGDDELINAIIQAPAASGN